MYFFKTVFVNLRRFVTEFVTHSHRKFPKTRSKCWTKLFIWKRLATVEILQKKIYLKIFQVLAIRWIRMEERDLLEGVLWQNSEPITESSTSLSRGRGVKARLVALYLSLSLSFFSLFRIFVKQMSITCPLKVILVLEWNTLPQL